jgi:SWI/SNF-related matrix-associated actin-dependent regulator 1 of chromatin subfamily A
MIITYSTQHRLWIATAERGENILLNRHGAGWRFHGDYCANMNRTPKCCKIGLPKFTWWTDDEVKAKRLEEYMDDKAKAALAGIDEAIEMSEAQDADIDIPCNPGLAYRPFQRAGIAYGANREATLIADEMGLGKTIQALGLINADPEVKSALIICPASLRINWRREAERWLVRPFEIDVIDVQRPPSPTADIVIVNYEMTLPPKLKRDGTPKDEKPPVVKMTRDGKRVKADYQYEPIEGCSHGGHQVVGPRGGTEDWYPSGTVFNCLMERQWDVLIADECHMAKNARGAQRAKVLLGYFQKKPRKKIDGLIDRASKRIFLSGTPIPNGKAEEIWPLLNALAPGQWGSWKSFMARYAGASQTTVPIPGGRGARRTIWEFDHERAKQNLPELQAKMRAKVMVRRLKADVLTELPPKIHQLVVLPANGQQRLVDAEDRALGEFKGKLQAAIDEGRYDDAIRMLDSAPAAFTEMAKLRADMAKHKVPQVIEHLDRVLGEADIDGTPTTKKVIVFAHHHAMIDALADHFGPTAVRLDGRMDQDERQVSVDRFQEDDGVRVFIGQIQAAGVGLTLTAANTVVFAEHSWVPGDNVQAEDRAHRIGQTMNVMIHHLVVDGSIDSMIAVLLAAKAERSNLALDGEDAFKERAREVVAAAAEKKKNRERAAAAARKAIENKFPAERIAAIVEGVQLLAGMCDGAIEKDRCGFNGGDTGWGKRMGGVPVEQWLPNQILYAAGILPKYHRQLGPELMSAIRG